jgi:hypothetical protein
MPRSGLKAKQGPSRGLEPLTTLTADGFRAFFAALDVPGEPNELLSFMRAVANRADHVLLGTATPIRTASTRSSRGLHCAPRLTSTAPMRGGTRVRQGARQA